MMRRKLYQPVLKANAQGFTLPEALVTLLIFAFIVGACLMILVAGSQSWRINSLQTELRQELRKGMSWIAEDLRQSGASTITDAADGTWRSSITFKVASGVSAGAVQWSSYTITYALGGTNTNVLQRTVSNGGGTKNISQDINLLQFRRQSTTPNIVEIKMQAQNLSLNNKWRNVQNSLSSKVKLRN